MDANERKAHESAVNAALQAHSIQSFLCDSCNHVHIVMYDEDGKILAHGTVSNTILQRILDLHMFAEHRKLTPGLGPDVPQG